MPRRRKKTTTRGDAPRLAVLYARVSTPEQAERDLSIPAQLRAMHGYADKHGLQVAEEYVEPGASATDDHRPVFRRMVEELLVRDLGVSVVLVYQTSRFFRDAGKARTYKERLRRRGIRVISISQEVADDPSGRLMEGMFECFDQYESEINGLRTRAAMKECARQGYFPGSRPPFGFGTEKVELRPGVSRSRLVPNPAEAEPLSALFRLYVSGAGAKSVARTLNQRGVLCRGKPWTKNAVLKVLEEEAAIGTYHWGKRDAKTRELRDASEWVAVPTEPILDRALFEMAQELRARKDPETRPGKTPSSPLLLSGLSYCGTCGASYQLESSGKNGPYKYRYYNCRSFLRTGREKCEGFRIPVEKLEQAVLEYLATRVFTAERCRRLLQDLVEETGVLRSKTAEHRRQLRQQLDDVDRRIRKWEDAFEAGEISPADGADRMRELRARRLDLEQALAKVVPLRSPPPHLYTDANIEKFQGQLRQLLLSEDRTLAKNYLRFLVERVEVHRERVRIVARSDSALRMMAGAGAVSSGGLTAEAVSLATVPDWLRRRDSNPRPDG